MEFKQLNIKQFIGDLPNIINSNFNLIADFINKLTSNDNTLNISASQINATGINVNGNISCEDITVKIGNKTVSLSSILNRLETLEESLGNGSDEVLSYSKNSKKR